MAPQNPHHGYWVQVWVPLPDPESPSANRYDTVTSNTIFDESTSPYSTENTSYSINPDSSDSPEYFPPSSYQSSPGSTLDSSFNLDDFGSDFLLFSPPQDGELSTDPDLGLGLDFEGDMDLSAPLPVSDALLNDLDPLGPFVGGNWDLSTEINNATTNPQISLAHASVSVSSSISISSSSLCTPPFPTMPALPSIGATPSLPTLQPASPRPGAATTATASSAYSAPYHCALCLEAFSKRSKLTKHERKHRKPHRCQLCDFGSAEPRGLQRHMWTNHREAAEREGIPKQIAHCQVCGYEGRLDNLTRHMKRHDKDRARGNKRKAAEKKRR